MPTFSSYVALGDSFTEGVGDPDPGRPNGWCGWADRVAEVLAGESEGFRYANLAIRGRKLRQVVAEQVDAAVRMKPELVSLYAGGNDILRPSVDIDAILDDYAGAVGRLREGGARVVLFTAHDLGWAPYFRRLRGRVAVYNELVREIAETNDATVVDFWRMREYQDPRLWDVDRIHMSSLGHRHMAVAVLDALGVHHDLRLDPLPRLRPLGRAERRQADLAWVRAHAAPWVQRRLTGRSSGDDVSPRYPELTPLGRERAGGSVTI